MSFTYFLVGALRFPGLPLLIDVKLLSTRTSTEVCGELEKMVVFFEALQSEGLGIGESCRIKRLHSDRTGEFTAPFFFRLSEQSQDELTIFLPMYMTLRPTELLRELLV